MKNWQRLRQQPELWTKFLMREQVIHGIREFFLQHDFHEVETPLLVEHPGTEPYLEVFETKLLKTDGRQLQAFLLTSPEYAMKKLIVAGMHNIFQICKSFRNGEGESGRHNPEFTILEWYRSPGDYTDIMDDCEGLLQHLAQKIASGQQKNKQSRGESEKNDQRSPTDPLLLNYQGKQYNLHSPWERISVAEAFEKYCGVSKEVLLDKELLKSVVKVKGYHVDDQTTWEQAYNQLLLNEIEPKLGQEKPTILYDYPSSQAALSQPKQDDPRFAERFEFFLGGLELGNAFSELNDAAEQERRFKQELKERAELGKTPYELDHDYIEALRVGLPPTGGIAVGVDRLVMLFADTTDLRDVTFFPVTDVFDEEAT
ncbi:EF-P lysine aminoacylase GenX [Patescibacteria group bacterium]|nr:EF-P lysine aminoacylase GenX [Patescibacteria group bacterium]